MNALKKRIPFELKIRVLVFLLNFRKNPYFRPENYGKGKKIYVFLVADYGNLGDVAISYAQSEFIHRYFPELEIIEVPISQSAEGMHFAQKHIKPGDLVATNGGGNFGDLYPEIETLRRLVIQSFPKNRIISFPQTVDFAENATGQAALKLAQTTYSAHKQLVLGAREERSFAAMKNLFPLNEVVLSPDIVMSLNKVQPMKERKGLVICLRNDAEKRLTPEQDDVLNRLISRNFEQKTLYDTHIGRGNLTPGERIEELNRIWDCFRSAELVITDRLHGMIFCFITGTPCLVFLNSNHKVIDCYEWIKSSTNIQLVTRFSEEEIDQKMKTLKNAGQTQPVDLSTLYSDLIRSFHPN